MNQIADPIEHKTILKYIGLIAFTMPIILIFGNLMVFDQCDKILGSISEYYHTKFGPYFIGSLSAIAFCLYAYRGYSAADNILSNVASVALLGVAFIPTFVYGTPDPCLQRGILNDGRVIYSNASKESIGDLHYWCAAIFFISITILCVFQFPKGNEPFDRKKQLVNRTFYACGALMISSLIFLFVYMVILDREGNTHEQISKYSPILFSEIIALWAFSISWFIKGKISFEK